MKTGRDEKNTEKTMFGFADIVRVVSSLSLTPTGAYRKRNADMSFASLLLPALTYILFSLQLVFDRLSFILTMTGIKSMLTVFIGLIVGAVTSLASAGIILAALNLRGRKSDYQCVLLCTDISYIVPVIISFVGLIARVAFSAPSTMAFGIPALLFSLIPYGRFAKDLLKNDLIAYLLVMTAEGLIIIFGANIIMFSVI